MKRSVRIFWQIFLIGFGAFILLIALANFGVFGKMPSLKDLENPSIQQASEVFAVYGTLMGKYYTERGNRSNVNYRDISPNVINALVATEDERFYRHAGIDFKSTMRAFLTFGKQGGGSTITQQLAKALLDQGSRNKAWRVIEKTKNGSLLSNWKEILPKRRSSHFISMRFRLAIISMASATHQGHFFKKNPIVLL